VRHVGFERSRLSIAISIRVGAVGAGHFLVLRGELLKNDLELSRRCRSVELGNASEEPKPIRFRDRTRSRIEPTPSPRAEICVERKAGDLPPRPKRKLRPTGPPISDDALLAGTSDCGISREHFTLITLNGRRWVQAPQGDREAVLPFEEPVVQCIL